MIKFNKIKYLHIILLSSVLLSACGMAKNQESIQPLYQATSLETKDIPTAKIEYWGDIGSTFVEPSGLQKLTRSIFGWIPILGDLLFVLPVDLALALLPPLPSISRPELPTDASWNDPKLINMISSLKLAEGYIRIIPPSERGPDYVPERCSFGTVCPEVGFDFLHEVRVYLIFKEPKDGSDDLPKSQLMPQVLLAHASQKLNYDRTKQMLNFEAEDVNLKPFLAKYGNFDVKIIATGRYPAHRVYIDGRLRLNLELKLAK